MKIEIDGKALNQHKSVKCLGILIDCHLNWKEHIQQLSKKISRGIGVLCKIRHYVNVKILVQLYHAIILPFFSYCCIIWGNTYGHNIKPLQRMQKKAIHLITFSDFDAHTSPLFFELKLLKLQDHIKLETLYFMHQFFSGKLPKILTHFLLKLQISIMSTLALQLEQQQYRSWGHQRILSADSLFYLNTKSVHKI